MIIQFLTLAQQEVDEAVAWLEDRAEGKEIDFLDELDRVVRLVRAYPLAWPEIEPEIRRCLFARFPYSLIYGVDDKLIIVIAVAHFHREPLYWIDRLEF
ncbi:MAG TPA: type II toxin-antitoxin system RelE/ParE family toxin [Pyrinomonadaceae bacterium]|nr:type II toxin-antitoxin system RelE/ParE family toxin [Pyrinomonadaceae bacterium]